jgi:hypothetical protein
MRFTYKKKLKLAMTSFRVLLVMIALSKLELSGSSVVVLHGFESTTALISTASSASFTREGNCPWIEVVWLNTRLGSDYWPNSEVETFNIP